MSSSLVWEPTDTRYGDLRNDLKFILRKRYGNPVKATLDGADVPYLQGLVDAGKEDVKEIIDLINKHHEIEIKEVWL